MQLREISFTESIAQTLEGNTEGFTFIYQNTYAYFRGIVKKYFSNTEEIEDLLQEIYIKIFTELNQLKDSEHFLAWSKMIVLNTVKNELRKKSSKIIANTESYPLYAEEDSEQLSLEELASYGSEKEFNRRTYMKDYQPEMYLEEEERKQILEEMLSQLPFMQKTCILLWQEGYSTKEIAEQLEIPNGTVLSNIHYSKKKIERKAEELKAHGLIIRSVTPFPFFLWLLDQYDLSLDFVVIGIGDVKLWEKIEKKISKAKQFQKLETKGRFCTLKGSVAFKATIAACVVGVAGIGVYAFTSNQALNHPVSGIEEAGSDMKKQETKAEKEKALQTEGASTEDSSKDDVLQEERSKQTKESKDEKKNHEHQYTIPIKETIYHDAVGHNEKVWVEEQAAWEEPIYEYYAVCNKCGHVSTNTESAGLHSASCGGGYSVKEKQVGTKHHDAVGHYEEQWIIDREAWTEEKTIGWKCSCGAKK